MNMMVRDEDREDGFSLVELLVVIVIIGILSAIAIGAFMNQRQKANDAALKSDLRTMANAYTSWSVNNGTEDFHEISGSQHDVIRHSLWVYGNKVEVPEDRRIWNNFPELPKLTVSPHNAVEVIVVHNTEKNDEWDRRFDDGEFCLAGMGQNTSWNYSVDGISGHDNYNKMLFFDAKLGGIKTMDELVEAEQSGQEYSCLAHTLRYMAAT